MTTEIAEQTAPELLSCPWCPTERRETYQTEAGVVGVITHETGCYLARHEDDRRQVLTPWGVRAWNNRSRSAHATPPTVETPAPERIWIQPNESNLSGVGPIWFTRRTGSGDIEYVRTGLSPSDAEQLSELRNAITEAALMIEVGENLLALQRLHAALTPQKEGKPLANF